MNAAAIRQELLTGTGKDLEKRRTIAALSAIGLVDFAFLSLYQSGVIRRLPELPIKGFDSNKVNAATEAYQMGAPDATISACVYASNMVLATAGGTEASGRKPVFDLLLGSAIAGNAAGALYYLHNMIFQQKKVCPYCVVGAAINLASAVIVAPLFLKAARKTFS
jgi:uncharacterized membrane protein